MVVLGEVLPVVLSNVPYTLTQTRRTHDVCTGLSLGIMGGMWMSWPHMPVDPRTLGGCVWYVADSGGLVEDVRSAMEDSSSQGEYFYGRVVGGNGRKRMVVDVA